MWQRNTWVVTMQISTKHNITEFYVAFTNRLIVILIITIITELPFVGFSNFSFSRDKRNVEFINRYNKKLGIGVWTGNELLPFLAILFEGF